MCAREAGALYESFVKRRMEFIINQLLINKLNLRFYEQKSTYALRGLLARG